jgi:hypothetical protein
MAEPRLLLVRLGSPGDIVHALPAAAALRDTFPEARIDCIVDSKWGRLLEGNSDLSDVISLKGKSASGISAAIRLLRSAKYPHAIDFQGLVVVRNPQFGETTYRRGASYSPAMLSITVEQVVEAVQRRLGLRS